MRRKEEVDQSLRLRAALTGMLILVGLMTYVLPGRSGLWTELLGLPFLLTLFAAVFCGALPGFLVGVTVPLAASLVLKQLDFSPDAIAKMVAYGCSGVVAGLFYGRFTTGLGAVVGAILFRLPVTALTVCILKLCAHTSYSLTDFIQEEIFSVHPGLLLPLPVIPLLVVLFRRNGLLEVLRGEPRE